MATKITAKFLGRDSGRDGFKKVSQDLQIVVQDGTNQECLEIAKRLASVLSQPGKLRVGGNVLMEIKDMIWFLYWRHDEKTPAKKGMKFWPTKNPIRQRILRLLAILYSSAFHLRDRSHSSRERA